MSSTLKPHGFSILGCSLCTSVPRDGDTSHYQFIRSLLSESHEGYSLRRCRHCGQMFLVQFHEIVDWAHGEDDIWLRWMPLTREEIVEIESRFPRSGHTEPDHVLSRMMHRRGRLVQDPNRKLYWSEGAWDAGDLMPPG